MIIYWTRGWIRRRSKSGYSEFCTNPRRRNLDKIKPPNPAPKKANLIQYSMSSEISPALLDLLFIVLCVNWDFQTSTFFYCILSDSLPRLTYHTSWSSALIFESLSESAKKIKNRNISKTHLRSTKLSIAKFLGFPPSLCESCRVWKFFPP